MPIKLTEKLIEDLYVIKGVLSKWTSEFGVWSTGPISIPVNTKEIVRKYAKEIGIGTTPTGILFLIQSEEDAEFIIAKVKQLHEKLLFHEHIKSKQI